MLPTEPIDATAGDVAWMAGRWVGEHDGDRIEEWWSEPYAGMLLGMFRWHRDGEPRFYELMSMEPEDAPPGLPHQALRARPGRVGGEGRSR